ncbi:uncharacterized protein ATC70_012385 [Mucor velutinosus]|uniref:Uncharacterized protein n=1 Tax=Mucor velutinosus TaxID=708070 RepID=A0AAN7D5H2_9FUNG|nr:hypothetical protein ATC70_012385 [Mucor velutinosus]
MESSFTPFRDNKFMKCKGDFARSISMSQVCHLVNRFPPSCWFHLSAFLLSLFKYASVEWVWRLNDAVYTSDTSDGIRRINIRSMFSFQECLLPMSRCLVVCCTFYLSCERVHIFADRYMHIFDIMLAFVQFVALHGTLLMASTFSFYALSGSRLETSLLYCPKN